MSKVERWRLTLEFSADEKKAREVRETIYDTARNTPGFRPSMTFSRALEEAED